MRRMIYVSLAMLLCAAHVSSATPDSDPKVKIVQSEALVKVIYDDKGPCRIKVTIKDDEDVVFTEQLNKECGFIRPYDLSNLPSKEYEVIVENLVNGTTSTEIVANYRKPEEPFAHVSRLSPGDNRYLFTIANENDNDVRIEILNSRDGIIYSDEIHVVEEYGCVFNVKHVPLHEPLTFVISNDHATKVIRVN